MIDEETLKGDHRAGQLGKTGPPRPSLMIQIYHTTLIMIDIININVIFMVLIMLIVSVMIDKLRRLN
jgi:hypothetical protein